MKWLDKLLEKGCLIYLSLIFIVMIIMLPYDLLVRISQGILLALSFSLWLLGFRHYHEVIDMWCLTGELVLSRCWYGLKMFIFNST